MKNKMLAKIYGEAEALVCLPLQRALGNHGSNNNAGWLAAYHARGLPFANSRPEVEALRALVADGLLTTRGATQGKAHKLTEKGVMAALATLGTDWADAGKLLSKIVATQGKSPIASPYRHHGGAALAMAWQLIPEAGKWMADALESDAAWKAYGKSLSRLLVDLTPLLILDCVRLLHDGRGYVWALMATEEGRAAAGDWPAALPMENCADELFDACFESYDNGLQKYAKEPPADFRNFCAAILPASGW